MDESLASKPESNVTEESAEVTSVEPEASEALDVDSAKETNNEVPEEDGENEVEEEEDDENYSEDDFEALDLNGLPETNNGAGIFPDGPDEQGYDEEDDEALIKRANEEDLLQGPLESLGEESSTATFTIESSTAAKSVVAKLKVENEYLHNTLDSFKVRAILLGTHKYLPGSSSLSCQSRDINIKLS